MVANLNRFPLGRFAGCQGSQSRAHDLLAVAQARKFGVEPLRFRCQCRPVRADQRQRELSFFVLQGLVLLRLARLPLE